MVLFIPSFKTIAYVVDKKAIYVEDTFCYRDYVCQVSKLQRMYVIDLIFLSVLETTKQTRPHQIEIKTFETNQPNKSNQRLL